MNKLFRKTAAIIVGAVIAVSSIGTKPFLILNQAYAAEADPAPAKTGKPEVLGYTVMSIPDPDAESPAEPKPLSTISPNKPFKLTINVMDRLLKGEDVPDGEGIIFTKSMGRFKCENHSVSVSSASGGPLNYSIEMDCTWLGGSSAFDFMIGYRDIEGDFFDMSFSVAECQEAAPDPGPSAAEPIFRISASNISEIKAGQSGSFTLDLKNLGSVDAERILVEVTAPDDVVLANGYESDDISYVSAGDSTSISVRYEALSKITSTKQSFGISLRYYYDSGNGETIGTASATVSIPSVISNDGSSSAEPIFKITPKNISEIKSGESDYFDIDLKNLGNLEAKRILIETAASDDVILTNGSGSQDLSSIAPNATSTIRISYTALGKINSAKQTFGITLHYYYDGAGGEAIGTASSSVNVPSGMADLAEVTAPALKVTGQTLAVPVTAGTEYEYTLTVRNFSDTPAEDVYLFLDASDSLYFVGGTETASVGSVGAKGSASVKVRFRTVDSIAAVKQGITAHISCSYKDGGVKKTAESDSSITIIASETNGGSGGGNSAAPNIIIRSYDIGAEQIAAGNAFDLKLDLFNTSSTKGVENVIMTINAGGSVNIFGGTNTFYYPSIGADGGVSETIPLKALATAETGTSSISVSLKYDYLDKDSRSTANMEQTIFIPVYQPDRMTFEVQVPTYPGQIGQDMYITTTYLNKGRSDISNVKAEIVGDVGALSTSKVIGTVQPGGNGSFDFIVNPFMPGACEFSIMVTYEDATLTEVTKEFPVSFEVEDYYDPGFIDPGFEDPGFEDPGMEDGNNFPWAIVWIAAGVVVAGGIVTIIIVVKHKKKKKSALTEADIDWEDEFEDKKTESSNNNNNNDNNTTTV